MMNSPILILFGVALGTVLLAWGFQTGREALANARRPVEIRPAQVIGKRVFQDTGTGWEPAEKFLVTFRLDSGEEAELSVPEREYKLIPHGAHGSLRLQGAWFRGFEPNCA